MTIPETYILNKFYTYAGEPEHRRYENVYNAGCPVCKEGNSWGSKKRLYYYPESGSFYCFNCSKSWKPFEWVKEVTTLTVPEIIKKNNEKLGEITKCPNVSKVSAIRDKFVIPDLPENSIELTDSTQIEFYKDSKFVKLALEYCRSRRLLTATNTCKRFFLSLEDKVHKNRLVIPFYDNSNKVICYQTRALTKHQFPKYLTKFGEKELFGINNIDVEIPYVFVFEGPIDSMFVKNGVAMASLAPTEKQLQQLSNLIGYEQIYVFDNDKNNNQTANKIEKYVKEGKKIFIWPKEFAKFKDFNEICCKLQIDEINWKFIVNNSSKG